MAMNKKDRAEVDALRKRDAMIRAVAWPHFPRPVPMTERPTGNDVVTGYSVNAHTTINYDREPAIRQQWRDCLYWYDCDPRDKSRRDRGGSQTGGPIYATEQDAARELAYQVAEKFGTIMAGIYAKCF